MRFLISIGHSITGPYEPAELRGLPDFSFDALVCPEGDDVWRPARQFPNLLHYEEETVNPLVEPDRSAGHRITPQNWREAIIAADAPERQRYAMAPRPGVSHPLATGAHPAKSHKHSHWQTLNLARWHAAVSRQRKSILALLGTIVAGVYTPQVNALMTIYGSLREPKQTALMLQGTRIRTGGVPHAPGSHRHHPSPNVIPVRSLSLPPAFEPLANAGTPQVVEIASDDMGNGFVMKTVVITREENGVKISQTKSYMVPLRKSKAKIR
jgi:hypothetical protein